MGFGKAHLAGSSYYDSVSSTRIIRLPTCMAHRPRKGAWANPCFLWLSRDQGGVSCCCSLIVVLVGHELVTLDAVLLLTLRVCASASVTDKGSPQGSQSSSALVPLLNPGSRRTLTLWPPTRYPPLPHPFCCCAMDCDFVSTCTWVVEENTLLYPTSFRGLCVSPVFSVISAVISNMQVCNKNLSAVCDINA